MCIFFRNVEPQIFFSSVVFLDVVREVLAFHKGLGWFQIFIDVGVGESIRGCSWGDGHFGREKG